MEERNPMDCFFCRVLSGSLVLKEHESARWLTPEELDTVNWLPADRELIGSLGLRLKQERRDDTPKNKTGSA